MITVTDSAVKQLQVLMQENDADPASGTGESAKGLRIFVESGGCAGMQYGMTIDASKEGDQVIERDGVRVIIDADSAGYMEGSVIDYADGLAGAGFKINNPNATRSCGCGTSFEPATEGETTAAAQEQAH